jgi:hypothetical protein
MLKTLIAALALVGLINAAFTSSTATPTTASGDRRLPPVRLLGVLDR